jgi:hypothetical protein
MIKKRIVAHRVVHREFPFLGIEADNSAPAAICYEHWHDDLLLGGGTIGLRGAPASKSMTPRARQRYMTGVLFTCNGLSASIQLPNGEVRSGFPIRQREVPLVAERLRKRLSIGRQEMATNGRSWLATRRRHPDNQSPPHRMDVLEFLAARGRLDAATPAANPSNPLAPGRTSHRERRIASIVATALAAQKIAANKKSPSTTARPHAKAASAASTTSSHKGGFC